MSILIIVCLNMLMLRFITFKLLFMYSYWTLLLRNLL